jgi:hypothetical protein
MHEYMYICMYIYMMIDTSSIFMDILGAKIVSDSNISNLIDSNKNHF